MDLFDKKSAIYSDRPKLWMGGELIGYSKTLVLAPYANRFRSYRRNFALQWLRRVRHVRYHQEVVPG